MEKARNHIPRRPLRCATRDRRNVTTSDTRLVRVHHGKAPRAQLPAPYRRVRLPSRVDGELPTPPWRPLWPRPRLTPRERRRVRHGRRLKLAPAAMLAAPRLLSPNQVVQCLRRVVLLISRALSRGGSPPEQPTTSHSRRRRRVHVAKPPRALSRPSKVTSGCAMTSWCFPTPPSPPTMPQPAGTGSSGEILCSPRDQGLRG